MIIVGQRVATIADADKIVVLEHGEIVGTGTHEELLADCPDVRGDRRLPAERRGGGGMSGNGQIGSALQPGPEPSSATSTSSARTRQRGERAQGTERPSMVRRPVAAACSGKRGRSRSR